MSAPKWSEAKDPNSGNTYFWNVDTNETSWDRPVAAGSAPPPPPPDTREQNVAASIDDPEQLLLNPPDPNLICPICLKLFAQPVRTACGHIFCSSCLENWLPQKSQCPECRTEVLEDTVPDRFAERLVSNLQGFCQFRRHGCLWVGKRGDMPVHLARECPCITVTCPNDNCGAEMLRRDLWQHLEICPAGVQEDCPWGCGERFGLPFMETHKSECLMEPGKLVAAIQRLRQENQRLIQKNRQLRREQPQSTARTQLSDHVNGRSAAAETCDLQPSTL